MKPGRCPVSAAISPLHEVWVSQTLCRPTLRQHPTTGHRCVATIDAAERTVGLHTNRVIWIVGLGSYRLTGRDCCAATKKAITRMPRLLHSATDFLFLVSPASIAS